MDLEVIIVIIVVVQFLHGLYKRMKGGQGTTKAVRGAAIEAFFDEEAPADDYGEYEIVIAHQRAQIEDAGVELSELSARLQAVRARLRSIGGVADALVIAVDAHVAPKLRWVEETLGGYAEALAQEGEPAVAAYVERSDTVRDAFGALATLHLTLAVLAASADWRQDRALAPFLADADAIAEDLFAPLQNFAIAHDLALRPHAPISAPASPEGEAVVYGLLPDHPVVFVPADFGGNLMRWPAIAHELGHVVWRTVPGVREEITSLVGPPRSESAVHAVGRRYRIDHRAVFSAWMEEIFGDFFAALTLGPAALRGLVHSFANPDDPGECVTIHTAPDGIGLDEHPPPSLRVRLVGATLLRMGYTEEVRALQGMWDEQHGEETGLLIPLDHLRSLRVRMEEFVALGESLVEALYTRPFSGLAGAPWTAVHGLEMTPGVWSRVLRRARELLDDEPFNDNGRVVVAAGIEAADLKAGMSARIARGVRRAILGRGARQAQVPDAHYVVAARHVAEALTASEVVESIVLRALLERKHARDRRRVHP